MRISNLYSMLDGWDSNDTSLFFEKINRTF